MKPIVADRNLIAFCGLYCGACGRYLQGKCQDCQKNEKVGWCKIRTCCLDNRYRSCADCMDVEDVQDCRFFNNFLAKMFSLIFRSNRPACIDYIKGKGYESFAEEMARQKKQSLPR